MMKRLRVWIAAVFLAGIVCAATGCGEFGKPVSKPTGEYTVQTAYAAALEKGYEGTLEDFIESISGEDGKSAYEIWLANGHEGTEADFLDWLRADSSACAHEFSEWHAVLAPSCTSAGVETRVCLICGGIEYRFMPEQGHCVADPSDYGQFEEKHHTFTCSECGIYIVQAHTYENFHCTVCGASELAKPLSVCRYEIGYDDIYQNETVGWVYRHKAIDLIAEAGAEVFAMYDGVVETIVHSAETGSYVTLDFGNGLKATYRLLDPAEDLQEGQAVKKYDVIGRVSQAGGMEAQSGAHLHLETSLNGALVDPLDYFNAEHVIHD